MKPLGSHFRWPLVIAAAVTGLAAYGMYIARPKPIIPAQSQKTSVKRAHASSKTHGQQHAEPVAAAPTEQASLSQAIYERAIRENMFNAPAPAEPKPAAPPARPPVVIVTPPPAPDPLADAVYAGSATVNGKTTALIESRSTHQGEYVFAGGSWQGHKVVAIAPDQITLSVNNADRTLMASDEVNVVPLSASAAGTAPSGSNSASAPQVPTPGAPTDPGAARMQMKLMYKSAMDSAKQMLQMRGAEMDLKNAQDKVQSLEYKKL